MSHGSGVYNFIYVARGGAHIIPESHSFDVAEMVDILGHVPRGLVFAAPTMVQRLIAGLPADDPLAGLKLIVCGRGPMLVEPGRSRSGDCGPRA
jgi:long-chain acyl-CoA synthetase